MIDYDVCNNIKYYRLKQVDIDGMFSYSDIVAVNCSGKSLLKLFPNPANEIVNCSFYEYSKGFVKLQWIDVIGQTIKEEIHEVRKGHNSIQSDVSELVSGIYYLRLSTIEKQSTDTERQIKFIKY